MADVTGAPVPTGSSAFNVPGDLTALADHFGGQNKYSVANAAALPASSNWAGRILTTEDLDLTYVWDGSAWVMIGGKVPFIFGARVQANLGSGSGSQAYITSSLAARGISLAAGVFTFTVGGIYKVDLHGHWESTNSTGQRNLGLLTPTGGTLLGGGEDVMDPTGLSGITQNLTTWVDIDGNGSTLTPYVTHNSGSALPFKGYASAVWITSG